MDVLALAPLFLSFQQVVLHKGLRPAARATGISTATLSRHLSTLEERLGVRLADRNTRTFALTAAGVQLMTSLGDLEGLLRRTVESVDPAGSLQGRIRLSAPTVLAAGPLMPVVTAFRDRYPKAVLQIINGDHLHTLIDEVDVVIRPAPLKNPDLMARRLFTSRETVIAAPTVAEAPIEADALVALPWIFHTHGMPPGGPRLSNEAGELLQFLPSRRIETNSSEHSLALIEAGVGVGIALEGIHSPRAKPLGWVGRELDFMLVHAGGDRPSRLVRALADLVWEHFTLGDR